MGFGDFIFFLLLLILSAGLGLLAQRILHLKLGGLFAATFLGLIGAYLGREMANLLHLPSWVAITIGHRIFPLEWSIIGAMLTVFVVASIAKSSSKQKKT